MEDFEKQNQRTSCVSDIKTKVEQDARKQQLEDIKSSYKDKLAETIDKYVKNAEIYGEEHFITQVSKMCCILVAQLDDVLNMIVELGLSLNLIDDVFSLMDDTMLGMDSVLKESLNKAEYTSKSRRESKKTQRRYVKNVTNRFKAVSDKLVMIQAISGATMTAVSKMTKSMFKSSGKFAKMTSSQAKSNAKQKGKPAGTVEFSDPKLAAAVEARRKELKADGTGSSDGGATDKYTPAASSSGVSGSDISDIVS